MKKLYHFLGGIYFALILIASVALFVIFGTFIESFTQSHRYAALFTYDNPLFALLLWGFFINILFSSIRRWPFQKKHVPFLITHLGLLMILAGVLAKHYFGVQGTMNLAEGTASDEILLPNTYAVHVESKERERPERYPLEKDFQGHFQGMVAQNDNGLSIRLTEFYPHCTEHLASWVKGFHAFIGGHPPIPLYRVTHEEDRLPKGGQAKLHHPDSYAWDLYALKTSDLEKTLSKLYAQQAQVAFTDRLSQQTIREIPLEILLKENAELDLNSPTLKINYGDPKSVSIPLMGDQALLNLHDGPQLSNLPIAIDIIQKPFFAIVQDEDEDVYLTASDPYGRVWLQPFLKGNLDLLIAYDDGFAGYTTRAIIPFKAYRDGRSEYEEALIAQFTRQLKQAMADGTSLAPPLQMIQNACKKTQMDFAEAATAFFKHWNDSGYWLYQETIPLPDTLKPVFAVLDWTSTPTSIKQGSEWVVHLFEQITPDLSHDNCLLTVLRKHGWPLIDSMEKEMALDGGKGKIAPYTFLTNQLFAASELRPPKHIEKAEGTTPEHQAALLSAYLRAYGIHFSTVLPISNEQERNQMVHAYLAEKLLDKDLNDSITLETLVSPKQQAALPMKKLEENKPKAVLFFSKGEQKQMISLAYEPTGKGMKWPIFDGEYLVRFQPLFKEIPYQVRLRQARQINYANSTQPYSFEGDLIFKDKKKQEVVEKTISMNKVHETWDGYRFYLSSIAPSDESTVKHVQIVVNYDPAKYFLTYPGAIVLSLGILLLFLKRPYR